MEQKILVLAPNLDQQGGNLVTLKRIRDNLCYDGITCELSSPGHLHHQEAFMQKVKRENVQLLIGIHLYKTGIFMMNSALPYIVIIGGTDVNVFSENAQKLQEMASVVGHARFVVCFSPELQSKVRHLWPSLDVRKIRVIPQGIEISAPNLQQEASVFADIKDCLLGVGTYVSLPAECLSSKVNPIVFSFIGGIRPVKNPLYLLNSFQEWHARDVRIWFLIIGPVMDQAYTEDQFLPALQQKPGVIFIPGVSLVHSHALMRHSFAVVNSSDNEGMSLAILEAMKLGVPVIARDNEGNSSVVSHGHTGLLFSSPQTFLSQAEWLINHPKERYKIISQAKDFVLSKHSLVAESAEYRGMVRECLSPHMSMTSKVPPVSEIDVTTVSSIKEIYEGDLQQRLCYSVSQTSNDQRLAPCVEH